jgi:hypothetical protein
MLAVGRAPPLLWWARLGVAVSAAWLVAISLARPWVGGDTPFVLDGTNAFSTASRPVTSSPAATLTTSTSGA